jgi:hypothetical protein
MRATIKAEAVRISRLGDDFRFSLPHAEAWGKQE